MSTEATPETPATTENTGTNTIEESLALAKRAFALKKYEEAVERYATVLELMTPQHGESSLEIAEVYFAYGRALLENAISQASVLGKGQAEGAAPAEETKSGAFLSFSGDAEESDEEEAEDVPVDLFGEAAKAVAQADQEQQDQEDEDDVEPEDDFNAAWEVLDLARAIFEKHQEESDDLKLKLAETYIVLGDVSLETEKFDQAITDYEAGLELKISLLPQSSRQIAEAHYKLSIVLDLSSGRLSDSIEHAEKALESVEARLAEIRNGLNGQMTVQEIPDPSDVKGKGKAKGPRLLGEDAVQNLNKTELESEAKELEGLREDLALKVEELKTTPNEPAQSAPEMVAKALDKELNAAPSSASKSAPVNDLTSMVKKKKKAPEASEASEANASSNTGKRKAEDDGSASPSEKKVKLDEATS